MSFYPMTKFARIKLVIGGVLLDTNELQILRSVTIKLLELNKQAHEQYVIVKSDDNYVADFYKEVKPFADQVLEVASTWKEMTLTWLKHEKVKYVYPIQVKDAYENLLIVSVKAFQKDTRAKRFNEMIKSIDYVLNTMLAQLS